MNPLLTRFARAFAASLLLLVLGAAVAMAAVGDIGHRDGSYGTGTGSPTGSKPESKVWFNDGFWWASERGATGGFFIQRLDTSTGNLVNTGVALDDRVNSRADILWDGTKLYVASQNWSDGGASTGGIARLYRYSYNTSTDTYALDNGFPTTMRSSTIRSETLVIAKDSTGMLWATWTQNSGSNRVVYTNHTQNGNDASWSAPSALNQWVGTAAVTAADDVSSVIAFNNGQARVGVFWSNQTATGGVTHDYFAWHVDGAADTAWTIETAGQGSGFADDHMNLKADSSGRIYTVVKTSSNPLVDLLVRQPGGGWSTNTVASSSNSNTRPILQLDQSAGMLHVFLTGPTGTTCGATPSGSGQSGGSIYEKTSPTSSISFSSGQGTPVMCDAETTASAHDMNNASSTKQNVNSSMGIMVVASNDTSDRYWHHYDTLGGGPPQDPQAAFTQDATSGAPGLTVNFTNQSTGTGLSGYAWDFGDSGTSTATNPGHQYVNPGTYTVALTATGTNGSNTVTKTNLITISAPSGTITLPPEADAMVKLGSTTKYGSNVQLRTREEGTTNTYRTFIRFNVQGITGTVTSVKLRLYVDTASSNVQSVLNTTDNPAWPELTTDGTNAPTIGGTTYTTFTATPAGAYKDITLPLSAINGNTPVTYALRSDGTTSAYFSSKEGANTPQLVITQTVGPSNTLPTANAASATTNEDTATPVGLAGLDPDAGNCELTFSLVIAPAKGTVNFAGQTAVPCVPGSPNTDSTSVTYTPNADANGSDSFTYKVNDGTGDSAPATASLTITPVDDPPTANAGSALTPQDTPKVLTLTGSDVDTCDLTFTVSTQPSNGTLTLPTDQVCVNGTNPKTDSQQITYTPTGGYNGPDSFQFTVADAATTSAPATFSLTVTPPNSLPTANATSANTNEDTPVSVALSGGDVETCQLTFSIVNGPSNGSLGAISNNNCVGSGPFTDSASVTYTPTSNYFGSDSFTYKVTDAASGDSTTATASLTIATQNDTPTAGNVNTSAVIGTPKAITLIGGDVETCDLTFAIVNQPGNGSLGSISNNNCAGAGPYTDSASVSYTATSGTSDSFTYRTTDGDSGNSTTATVTISISGGTPTSTTVPVLMDSQVQSGSLNGNYGTLTPFRTREGADPIYRLYFKFQVPALSGSIISAKLRLYVTTASTSQQTAYAVADTAWTEGGITWTNAPLIGAAGPSAVAASPVNTYIEIPVSPSAITLGDLTSLAVKGSTTTSAYFNSRESATNKPELVIVTGP